jgi:hypothetical protein
MASLAKATCEVSVLAVNRVLMPVRFMIVTWLSRTSM